MSVTRGELSRTQKNVVSWYKKKIKELKSAYEEDSEGVGSKLNLLRNLKALDYDLNNMLTTKVQKELELKEKDLQQRKEIAELRVELEMLKSKLN